MRRIATPHGVDLLRITMVKTPRSAQSLFSPPVEERGDPPDRRGARRFRQSLTVRSGQHRKELDPKLFAYLGA